MDILKCSRCKLEKPVDEFFERKRIKRGYTYLCKVCNTKSQKEWKLAKGKKYIARKAREYKYRMGIAHPQNENAACSNYLGIWIAERILSKYFDNISRMPVNNPGFDYICSKGFKIDVKSSCRENCKNRRVGRWTFVINKNKIADYFLCIAFDNRSDLNPEHLWLIPSALINEKGAIVIYDNQNGLSKWMDYEKPIGKVLECCNSLKSA